MSNPVKVKEATGGSSSAAESYAWLNGGKLLYAQPTIYPAPVPYTWYGARWLYLRGGTYTVKAVGEQRVEFFFNDSGEALIVTTGSKSRFSVKLNAGANLIKFKVTNEAYNSSSYFGFTLTRDGSSSAEYVSVANGMSGDLDGYPDVGSAKVTARNINVPIWSIEPDWGSDVTESFEWLTDVLSSESGAEQRRKIRKYPRRTISFSVTEWASSQRRFDIAAATIGMGNCLLPIYFDKQFIKYDAKAGETEITGDFVDRINYCENGLAILINPHNHLVSERVVVKSVSDEKIVISSALKDDWPAGTLLYPCALARITEVGSVSRVASDALTGNVTFELLDPLPVKAKWNYTSENPSTGMNVLTGAKNNWREAVTVSMARNVVNNDNSVSDSIVVDSGGDSVTTQRMSLMMVGKSQYARHVEMLYAMAGQFSEFQFPTRFNDVVLAKDISHASGHLVCEKSGYAEYKGSSQFIRQFIMISLYSGQTIFARVISIDTDKDYDYLVLEQAFGNINKSDVLMICWCPVSRLASDNVELQHHTDIEGVTETVLAIESHHDRRKV